MATSSAVVAGPIVGSITFTGTTLLNATTVGGDGDFAVLPAGTPVDLSLLGWEAGGYSFSLDWSTLEILQGVVGGSGYLQYNGTNNTFAMLSGNFGNNGYSFTTTATGVPAPQSLALLGIGLLAFGAVRVAKAKRKS